MSVQERRFETVKNGENFVCRKLLFCTLDDLLQTHFVSTFRFEALKGYFMVFSTDINFSPLFDVSKKNDLDNHLLDRFRNPRHF